MRSSRGNVQWPDTFPCTRTFRSPPSGILNLAPLLPALSSTIGALSYILIRVLCREVNTRDRAVFSQRPVCGHPTNLVAAMIPADSATLHVCSKNLALWDSPPGRAAPGLRHCHG